VFHIPYVLELQNEPAFKDDPFYSSLKNFASIVWPIIRSLSTEANIYYVFGTAHFLSRFAAFAALIFLLRINGTTDLLSIAVCLGAISCTPWFQGDTTLGDHGMFIDHFTHSEATWPFIFLSLGFLQLRRRTESGMMIGVTFLINSFIGIWMGFVSAISMLFDRQQLSLKVLVKMFMAFIVTASPVILWIAFAINGSDSEVSFSYIEYIRKYFPQHFLIEAADKRSIVRLVALFICGFLATRYVGNKTFWVGVQIGCLALFTIGTFLPYVWNNRFVFNLHLLRSDGLQQAIAIILTSVASVKLLLRHGCPRCQMLGVVLLSSIVTMTFQKSSIELLIALMALTVGNLCLEGSHDVLNLPRTFMKSPRNVSGLLMWGVIFLYGGFLVYLLTESRGAGIFVRCCLIIVAYSMVVFRMRIAYTYSNVLLVLCLAIGLVASASQIKSRIDSNRTIDDAKQEWTELVEWVRSSDVRGTFLVPIHGASYDFQFRARRPIWVDWKQGAAVMWSPPFHAQWSRRLREVSALQTPEELVAYARENSIRNVLIKTDTGKCPLSSSLRKHTRHYVVCEI
jgi:hypothetical protein